MGRHFLKIYFKKCYERVVENYKGKAFCNNGIWATVCRPKCISSTESKITKEWWTNFNRFYSGKYLQKYMMYNKFYLKHVSFDPDRISYTL